VRKRRVPVAVDAPAPEENTSYKSFLELTRKRKSVAERDIGDEVNSFVKVSRASTYDDEMDVFSFWAKESTTYPRIAALALNVLSKTVFRNVSGVNMEDYKWRKSIYTITGQHGRDAFLTLEQKEVCRLPQNKVKG
jgi:hypothetical protein